MFISPEVAIREGWITHKTNPNLVTFEDWKEHTKFVNPNAIDFTLDRLFELSAESPAIVTENERVFREVEEVSTSTATQDYMDGQWVLEAGRVYDGMSDFHVEVPEDVVCILINRSTFNRCGVHLNSGLYDTGFNGNIGFSLTVRSGDVVTAPGTRVGQIAFIKSESVGEYNGIYNNAEEGVHWSDSVNGDDAAIEELINPPVDAV